MSRSATEAQIDDRAARAGWAADGPAPWDRFAAFLAAWVAAMWATAELAGWQATAVVVMLGLIAYWLLLPKAATGRSMPGWTLVPLAVAFVAGIFLAGYMAELDEGLTAAGYGVWFVLWLQLGLWLRDLR